MKKTALAFVVAVAFTGSAIAADSKYDAFMSRVVGNQTTVSFGSGGTPVVTSSANLGTPAVGNMGLSQSGKNVSLAGNVKLPVAGTSKTIDAVARAPISRLAFVRGVAGTLSGPLGWAVLAASAPDVIDWLGQAKIQSNPEAADYPGKPFLLPRETDGYVYRVMSHPASNGWFNSRDAACTAWKNHVVASYAASGFTAISPTIYATSPRCNLNVRYRDKTGVLNDSYGEYEYTSQVSTAVETYPASMNDIAPYLDRPETPALTPQVVESGITKAGIDPFGAQAPEITVTGPATTPQSVTKTQESVRLSPGTTTIAPPSASPTDPGIKETTTTGSEKLTYDGSNVRATPSTVTNVTVTNNTTNQTINEGDTITETENPEITVCGLPGTPACKIDETGTPEAKQDTAADDAKKAFKPLEDFVANPTSALPTFPTINWAFTLPSGCAPIALPAFEPWLQQIDICAFQPMFHDLMSFVWVMGGIFGAIGTFWRNTFSQG